MDSSAIQGTVDRVIFHNCGNGFSIFVFVPHAQTVLIDQPTSFVVKGHFPALFVGQDLEIAGSWTTHSSFGKQFLATEYKQLFPTSISGIQKFLSSGWIKGIGEKYADALVQRFGKTTLTVIDQFPEELTKVPGIGEKRAQQIIESWREQKDIVSLMVFLQEKNISPLLATKIYKQYAHNTRAILEENPYRLAEDIWGIGFLTADTIAQKMGFALTDSRRINAGILYALKEITTAGHLYIEAVKAHDYFYKLLTLEPAHDALIAQALSTLQAEEKICVFTVENKNLLGLAKHRLIEEQCAQKLKLLRNTPSVFSEKIGWQKIERYLSDRAFIPLQLNQQQQEGVRTALAHKVSFITGGPGTGKTTLLSTLLSILEAEGISYRLAAPTGRAAQRMYESTARKAQTIHRLLEFDAINGGFKRNQENPLKTLFVIIDEASMVDIFLAHSLLGALEPQTHVLFIGDYDQLPSVGAGNFLVDAISSSTFPCTRLCEIFRQAHNSMIITNAHRINKGEMPQWHSDSPTPDFVYIKETNPENIEQQLKHCLFALSHRYGLAPTDMHVLVPMNRSGVGTQTLNPLLQKLLNAGPSETVPYGTITYKLNDKVMQLRNNYTKEVFNGDIGYIVGIDQESKSLTVRFEDRTINYVTDELNELTLAYATTIHKSQGSEYPAVIIPLFMQHYMLLQRNLIYTAVTRAKKVCILIGEARAIACAVKTSKSVQRTTCLSHFLRS